jgi:hypothetical protein
VKRNLTATFRERREGLLIGSRLAFGNAMPGRRQVSWLLRRAAGPMREDNVSSEFARRDPKSLLLLRRETHLLRSRRVLGLLTNDVIADGFGSELD